jgi:glycosyltransferase involved in cell wall biosynthesis
MRIAFQPFGGDRWLGGLHYLQTLISALREHCPKDLEPVLVTRGSDDPDAVERLRPLFATAPVHLNGLGPVPRARRVIDQAFFARDRELEAVCRRDAISVVFQHAEWLGFRFGLPTVAWLGDFQHRVLPEMFPPSQYWRRELRFRTVFRGASVLYVLSETDRRLGRDFYPRHAAKLRALPFAVAVPSEVYEVSPARVAERHRLPQEYFFFPGQLWKHKNHLKVIDAVARSKAAGDPVTIVACGNAPDHRAPEHARRVAERIAELGLGEQFRLLGLLPRMEVWALMRGSVAVLNPSRYEGWSTPVEEAKAVGAPLVLSDIGVHREQAPNVVRYFDPSDAGSLARALAAARGDWGAGPHLQLEERARDELPLRRNAFAMGFAALAREATRGG